MLKKPYPMPTQAELRIHFVDYDHLTGALINSNGKRAGSVHKASGYRVVYVRGKYLPEHKVIWCYNYGTYPDFPILHKDGNRTNNRLSNLYQAHATQKKATSRRNRSGASGISWYESTKQWRVTVYTPHPIHIGYYADLGEAKEAQAIAYRRYNLQQTQAQLNADDDWLNTKETLTPTPTPAQPNETETVSSIPSQDTTTPVHMPKGWTKV